jgi:hypothetical protein
MSIAWLRGAFGLYWHFIKFVSKDSCAGDDHYLDWRVLLVKTD